MWYLISSLFWPLLLALLLGVAVGWMTCGRQPGRFWSGWVPLGTLAFAIGLLVAIFKFLPARAGLALDSALLFFGAYLIGCCLGCLIRQWLAGSEPMPAVKPVMAAAPAAAMSAPVAVAPAAPVASVASFAAPRLAAAPQPPPPPVVRATAPAPAAPEPAAVPAPSAVALKPTAPEPEAAPAVAGEDLHGGRRPAGLASPRGGKADDLKLIRGIGRQNEGRLHGLGIWHFDQIAGWTRDNIEWVGSYLAFPGRIDREDWINQARQLASGATTEFAARVQRGEVATSKDDGSLGQGNVAALGADGYEGVRPKNTLIAARDGKADDLKLVNGIGRSIEQKLNGFGVWHFDQIAAMSDDELRFISHAVGFPGRALREKWREDSATLAKGGDTAHSLAVKAGKIPSSSGPKG